MNKIFNEKLANIVEEQIGLTELVNWRTVKDQISVYLVLHSINVNYYMLHYNIRNIRCNTRIITLINITYIERLNKNMEINALYYTFSTKKYNSKS